MILELADRFPRLQIKRNKESGLAISIPRRLLHFAIHVVCDAPYSHIPPVWTGNINTLGLGSNRHSTPVAYRHAAANDRMQLTCNILANTPPLAISCHHPVEFHTMAIPRHPHRMDRLFLPQWYLRHKTVCLHPNHWHSTTMSVYDFCMPVGNWGTDRLPPRPRERNSSELFHWQCREFSIDPTESSCFDLKGIQLRDRGEGRNYRVERP
mmetsp:Transcript_26069/g.43486  ORF Transcript_26069/g.43486 Transcript_26069/m.43486 type:complete len:210 (+) Transcript_26069:218-847(+)